MEKNFFSVIMNLESKGWSLLGISKTETPVLKNTIWYADLVRDNSGLYIEYSTASRITSNYDLVCSSCGSQEIESCPCNSGYSYLKKIAKEYISFFEESLCEKKPLQEKKF